MASPKHARGKASSSDMAAQSSEEVTEADASLCALNWILCALCTTKVVNPPRLRGIFGHNKARKIASKYGTERCAYGRTDGSGRSPNRFLRSLWPFGFAFGCGSAAPGPIPFSGIRTRKFPLRRTCRRAIAGDYGRSGRSAHPAYRTRRSPGNKAGARPVRSSAATASVRVARVVLAD